MVMIFIVAIGAETIFLVVAGMARDAFVGVDLFDLSGSDLLLLGGVGGTVAVGGRGSHGGR